MAGAKVMKYYKHNKTGEVFAYEQSDIDTVNSIASIENTLSEAQDALASLTAPPEFVPKYDEEDNQTNVDEHKSEREEHEQAKQAVADAEKALAGINEVFFKIRDNLASCTEMTAAEVEERMNPTPTPEQLADQARAKRDHLINGFIWRINRHRDELDLGLEPTEPLEPLLQYVQDLRDVPAQAKFPQEVVWPIEPELPR